MSEPGPSIQVPRHVRAVLLSVLCLAAVLTSPATAGAPYAGRSLEDALLDLEQQGL